MKKFSYLFIPAMIFAVSCQKSETVDTELSVMDPPAISETIPVEQAVENLSAFMDGLGKNTKSSLASISVSAVGRPKGTKVASCFSDIPDTLVYVMNLGEGEGAAIVSANKRLKTSVFCLLDSGSIDLDSMEFTEEDFNNPIDLPDEEDREMSDEEPDGFECAMSSNFNIEKKVINCCYQQYRSASSDFLLNDSGGCTNGSDATVATPVITKYGPYLKTKWGQGSPFNDLVGGRNLGCVATATAQLIVFTRPDINMTLNGVTCDWETMLSVKPYENPCFNGLNEARNQVANFCYIVQNDKNCNVNSQGGSNAARAQRALRNFNFVNVKRYMGLGEKNMDIIKTLLKNAKPVLICAKQPSSFYGHAFILDGLYYTGGLCCFHINWGWNGYKDGYFACGIFDTSHRVAVDGEIDGSVDREYEKELFDYDFNWWYRFLTYEN